MAMAVDDLTCRELVELVTEYLEGGLDPAARRRVDAHLSWCLGCRGHLRDVRTTLSLLRALCCRTPV